MWIFHLYVECSDCHHKWKITWQTINLFLNGYVIWCPLCSNLKKVSAGTNPIEPEVSASTNSTKCADVG